MRTSAQLNGDEPSAEDGTYQPGAKLTASRPKKPAGLSPAVRPDRLVCFATEGANGGHRDASRLVELGVWLGAADDHDAIVTGRSFTAVIEQYYAQTQGGQAEPKTNGGNRGPNVPTILACASCHHLTKTSGKQLAPKEIAFQHKDMWRLVSLWRCRELIIN